MLRFMEILKRICEIGGITILEENLQMSEMNPKVSALPSLSAVLYCPRMF